jgi:hypothetical protein
MPDVKINSDFQTYKESIFFGLSMRQFVCSALAVLCAAAANIPMRVILGKDLAGFIAFVTAIPLALAGFWNYNGMPFEKLAIAFIRQTMLAGFPRLYKTRNYLYEALRDAQTEIEKERAKQPRKRKPAQQPRTRKPAMRTVKNTKPPARRVSHTKGGPGENTKPRPAPPKRKQGKNGAYNPRVNTNRQNHARRDIQTR